SWILGGMGLPILTLTTFFFLLSISLGSFRVRKEGWSIPSRLKSLLLFPLKYTGITGTFAFLISLPTTGFHSLSITLRESVWKEETSPAGNIPTGFPAFRCSRVSLIPRRLDWLTLILSNGFTGRKKDSIFFIFWRRKLAITLK